MSDRDLLVDQLVRHEGLRLRDVRGCEIGVEHADAENSRCAERALNEIGRHADNDDVARDITKFGNDAVDSRAIHLHLLAIQTQRDPESRTLLWDRNITVSDRERDVETLRPSLCRTEQPLSVNNLVAIPSLLLLFPFIPTLRDSHRGFVAVVAGAILGIRTWSTEPSFLLENILVEVAQWFDELASTTEATVRASV